MSDPIFRIADPDDFAQAMREGSYHGADHDKADGFIHASTRAQLADTLALHYSEFRRVAIAEIDPDRLTAELKWEAARAGDLFPHIYGALNWSAVVSVHLVKQEDEGGWRLGEGLNS